MANKLILILGVIFFIIIISVVVIYFATRQTTQCFKGDFKCEGNNALTCSSNGMWIEEVCHSPYICGGGGVLGCGLSQAVCGDGYCDNKGDNFESQTCPQDCVIIPPNPYCGDNICQSSESKNSCPDDCGLPLPTCGDGKCVIFHYPNGDIVDEFLVCPQDCGIVCGDGMCVTSPYDERKSCPADCQIPIYCGDNICQENENKLSCSNDCKQEINNANLIYKINQKNRPLVGGILMQTKVGSNDYIGCSLGAVISSNGKNYILTASHCVTLSPTKFPTQSDLGNQVSQGIKTDGSFEKIGNLFKIDSASYTDAVLISIDSGVSNEQKDILGNKIEGFGNAIKGTKIYKIGITTGLTYGTIGNELTLTIKDGGLTKIARGYIIISDSGDFCTYGDSGSAIITLNSPHKIVGLLTRDGVKTSLFSKEYCFAIFPEDIQSKLGI